jgi:hypothetical protein
MSDYVISEPRIYNQEIDEISTTQNLPLGTTARAFSPTLGEGEFVYAAGVASTVLGDVCGLVNNGASTVRAVANGKYRLIGVAMAANVASSYGWYQTKGKAVGKVAASFADNADCYLTATAGTIDDADVAGDYIRGMKGASAIDTPSTGLAYLQMNGAVNTTDGTDN